MNTVEEIFKATKKLTSDDKERLIYMMTVEKVKTEKIVNCKFCGCRLWMDIEREHNKCWDCHYEGKGL